MNKNENKNSTTVKTTGLGFFSILALIFITLKLLGIISWNWIWVLSPIWINMLIGLVFAGFVGLYLIIVIVCTVIKELID